LISSAKAAARTNRAANSFAPQSVLREFLNSSPLRREFYVRPAVEVARALLGKVLVHGGASARIVETEAYLGLADAASHASRGRTPRTEVIFGPPGFAYVYLIYGIHNCLNIVAEPEGSPGCVLIRALEPLAGLTAAQRTNGPGKLTRAMGITLRHYGVDVTRGPIAVHAPRQEEAFRIGVSPRIGITHNADWPLRFFIEGNRFVSGRG
jgi:DNA-3-methyladenine glycosylase